MTTTHNKIITQITRALNTEKAKLRVFLHHKVPLFVKPAHVRSLGSTGEEEDDEEGAEAKGRCSLNMKCGNTD